MWAVCALSILLFGLGEVDGAPRDVFRTGAVLAESGDAMDMVDAKRGYTLGAHVVNQLADGTGFTVTDVRGVEYHFKFDFESLNDGSDEEQHEEMLRTLLKGNRVDFLFGSHPKFALAETRLANNHQRINMQCCVGPDSIYEQNLPYVFGVQGSNTRYPQPTMQSMILRGIRRLGVIWKKDNLFTDSTCREALVLAQNLKGMHNETMEVVVKETYSDKNGIGVRERFVEECIDQKVEAVVACTFSNDGTDLVEAFHSRKKSMKAFFMTVGPSHPEWVQNRGDKADFLLSAGQWHHELFFNDMLFGSAQDYKKRYQNRYNGSIPTYVAAGASASVYSIMSSIQSAFRECNLSKTGGDIDQLLYNSSALSCTDEPKEANGYERVRLALETLDLDTFFGRIKLNKFRQNTGCQAPTIQVLPDRHNSRNIHLVHPGRAVPSELKMPSQNKYQQGCKPGYFMGKDEFSPCQPCRPGTFSENKDMMHCERCPAGSYASQPGSTKCTECPRGKITDGLGAKSIKDCQCLPGFYRTQERDDAKCDECPFGAVCNGGILPPFPKHGYWMSPIKRSVAYECDPEDICCGGPNSACRAGYTGRMCSECSEGYFGLMNTCNKCPSKLLVVICIVVMVLGWYMINVVVSKSVASLEMILSWAQLANVVGDIHLRWPHSLQVIFGVANILDFDVDVLEPSCLTSWSFVHNFGVQLALPFLMSLMASLGYLSSLVVQSVRRKLSAKDANRLQRWLGCLVTIPHSEEELCAKWDATIATFLSSIEVTYITVAKYCFDVFKCESIGGVSVLRTAPSIECGTHKHRMLMVLGSVGTIVYSFGYLAFVSWKIWQLYSHRTLQEPQNHRRYGFLYSRFELDYCWTGIVILARRLLFVIVLVFVNNPEFQAGALAIIINASLMLHVYTTPYVDTHLDVLFSFLLVALMFKTFSGVLFYSIELPKTNRLILEWMVTIILCLLVVLFTYFLLTELKRKYENHFVKRMHFTQIMCRKYSKCLSAPPLFSFVSREGRDAEQSIDRGLIGAFDSLFLYTALKNHPEHIGNWDKLNEMMKDVMCRNSQCSYLSRDPVAKFWRKLVDRFPELVDFLAVADDESREHFNAFATTLYQGFYLTNKVEQLPMFRILNWRDRACMAQWLAIANREDRKFLTSFVSDLFQAVGGDPIQHHEDNVAHGPAATNKDIGLQIDTWAANRARQLRTSSSRKMALAELSSGRNPLEFKPRKSWTEPLNCTESCKAFPDMKSVPECPEEGKAQSPQK